MSGKYLLLCLIATGLLMPFVAASGSAAKPVVQRVDIVFDPPFFVMTCTGFDVFQSGGGFLVIHTFFDDQGNLVKDVTVFHLDDMTLTNSVSGKSLTGPSVGPNILKVDDGTLTANGLFWIVRPDHGKPIVLDAGLLVLDLGTFEVLSASGPKGLNSPELLGQLCSLLA